MMDVFLNNIFHSFSETLAKDDRGGPEPRSGGSNIGGKLCADVQHKTSTSGSKPEV